MPSNLRHYPDIAKNICDHVTNIKAHRKVRWALSISKRAAELRAKIQPELTAIQVAISQQVIQITLQMPSEIQVRVAKSIEVAINTKLRPLIQNRLSKSDTHAESRLESIMEGLRRNEVNHSVVVGDDMKDVSTSVEETVTKILGGLDNLEAFMVICMKN
ncbi:hypothetical protein QBC35DRAFT_234804 [Podospora australis]|uniref:Uncharacterized protein n=1 Tax=Podospora australis TaxID=1536484 RepID=A0AAN6WTT5_9PEZI|nr:hypothetical protein QBC35DRAFT_234804 [Podospora australis]